MQVHETLAVAAFILLLIAAVFELPVYGGPAWPTAWAHVLGWLGLALFVLSTRVT